MTNFMTRPTVAATTAVIAAVGLALSAASAQDEIKLRMSTPASETDQRSVALANVFAPAVADFAAYEPHYNASLVAQGSELEAIASGDLEMSIASAQELATFFPEFSIFATGYVHQDAAHQVAVFNDPLMEPFKKSIYDFESNVKKLAEAAVKMIHQSSDAAIKGGKVSRTVILVLLGTPLAWWLSRTRSRLKPAIQAIVALPIVLPPTVMGFYLLIVLGPYGAIGRWWVEVTGEALTFSFTGLPVPEAKRGLNFYGFVANGGEYFTSFRVSSSLAAGSAPVIGITGTGGAGKSSLTDELILSIEHALLPEFVVGIDAGRQLYFSKKKTAYEMITLDGSAG